MSKTNENVENLTPNLNSHNLKKIFGASILGFLQRKIMKRRRKYLTLC